MAPIPAVLMKIPSPLPLSTTLVSPVTISTPAAAAARCIDATTRRKVSMGNPSSMMKPALKYSGRAPHMARSLTVPFTASVPMSPPGKNRGRMTYESVLNASRTPPIVQHAPSCRAFSRSLANTGKNTLSSSLLAQPASAPVRHHDVGVVADWSRTHSASQTCRRVFARFGHSKTMRPIRRDASPQWPSARRTNSAGGLGSSPPQGGEGWPAAAAIRGSTAAFFRHPPSLSPPAEKR